ncbi:MAG: galactokinase [Clostridia bacterium]|nr:galactokinase [Clostridia bacterium]
MNEFYEKVKDCYNDYFDRTEEVFIFAPGRVNLIGEHIDYNGGKVLPCSLSVGTYGAASKRKDGRILLVSADFSGSYIETEADVIEELKDEPESFEAFGWAAYPLGVFKKLLMRGFKLGGFEMAVSGSLPRGSGLSSSASLEILTCAVLKKLFRLELDGVTASVLSVEAERDCAGVNCGIMDQFICAMGKKDKAILLDTSTLEYEYTPFILKDYTLLIMNTKKPRRLADSKYNERRAECEKAVSVIGKKLVPERKNLCDITPEEFDRVKELLKEPVIKRARHAVYENGRTLDAVRALQNGDIALFGKLIDASHDSLRDDYEVTGIELDTIVEAARAQKGVLGARMTGAGFGGCAIALVEKESAEEAKKNIERIYKEKIGYDCEIMKAETFDSPFAV